MTDYESFLKQKDVSTNTIASYLADLEAFKNWYRGTTGEEFDPGAIGPIDVVEYKRYMLNRNRKPATINRHLASLSAYFRWAVERGLSPQNPVDGIKSVKQERLAPKWLERREQLSLLRAVQASKKPRDIALINLLLHTGLRVSEVCALDLDDVFLRERSGWVVVRSGKGGKRREVPLNATVRSSLADWIEARCREPGPLFFGQKGNRMTSRGIEHLIAKYARIAGVEKVTPHSLRHTFCKSLIDSGESLDRVAVLAGHESLNTTARYTRPSVGDLQKSVDKLAWE
ncbi:MAG TPA: tyrosine-type recombinase/integrase [Bacillota bacterium]|nr:tyrosine-type recombinase/integrase [Bacillota bacterium]